MGNKGDPFDSETPPNGFRFPKAEEELSGVFSTAPPPRPLTEPPPTTATAPPPPQPKPKPYKTLRPPPASSLRAVWDAMWEASAGRLLRRLTGRH